MLVWQNFAGTGQFDRLGLLVSYADLQWFERLEDTHDVAAALAVSDEEREPFDPAVLLRGGEEA